MSSWVGDDQRIPAVVCFFDQMVYQDVYFHSSDSLDVEGKLEFVVLVEAILCLRDRISKRTQGQR